MSVYFSSDQHFGHATARRFYRRPFGTVAEMDQQMIERWNAVVQPGNSDEVWLLGDFAVRQSSERVAFLLNTLNGRKHLIIGNNDDAVVSGCGGWQSAQPYAEITLGATRLVLCHYPFRSWRNKAKGAINLHGHSHGKSKSLPRQFDVGVDVWDFRPVSLEQLLATKRPRGFWAVG